MSESVTEFADRCRECGARYGKLLEQKSWNPVKEGLPKISDTYLVTIDGEICGIDHDFVSICGFEDGRWDEDADEIIAWMPLPKPYKESENKCQESR